MVPVPIASRHSQSPRLVYILFSLATHYVPHFIRRSLGDPRAPTAALDAYSSSAAPLLAKRGEELPHDSVKFIVFATLIPLLVILSGVFAGLTLGYMSLDETQLNVLSISGTPEQKRYAMKIMPVRKNGHLLLVTLLLSNMIVNETLPVIADPVLGGGFQGVIVATVLIVIFAEIIPQSLFTRHGLYLGAKMAGFTRCLIVALCIFSWPVAKLLELVLGPHHGIIYRRAELKELIAMHSSREAHGGDLKIDTVTIIGATLDLQEKVVKQAMTPIEQVFMLSIDSKLDYGLLKKICQTGHSRVPVYEEVEVPERAVLGPEDGKSHDDKETRIIKVKKIIGILLVKQCVLLDPKDATPLRKIPLNKVPSVPNNEPLLGILDKFQEGGSHMAIVSRFSIEKAASVKKAVKHSLTKRLRARVKIGETDSDTDDDEEDSNNNDGSDGKQRKRSKFMDALRPKDANAAAAVGEATDEIKEEDRVVLGSVVENNDDVEKSGEASSSSSAAAAAVQIHVVTGSSNNDKKPEKDEVKKNKLTAFQLPKLGSGMTSMSNLEQSMPADAVLNKQSAVKFLQSFDPAVMPLGIITLEDILEELIGEEIYDEFDNIGGVDNDPTTRIPVLQVQDADKEATATSRSMSVRPGSISATTRPEPFEGAAAAAVSAPHQPHLLLPPPGPAGPAGATGPVGAASGLGKNASLKGRGFFRARSAPPISRAKRPVSGLDEAATPTTTTTTAAAAVPVSGGGGSSSGDGTPTLAMPKPIKAPPPSTTRFGAAPPVILEQQQQQQPFHRGLPPPPSSSSSTDSGTLVSTDTLPIFLLSEEGQGSAAAAAANTNNNAGMQQVLRLTPESSIPNAAVAVGRLAPSGPSLEAILLDRKRRLAAQAAAGAAGGGASPGPSNTSATPAGASATIMAQGGGAISSSPVLQKDFAAPSPAPFSPEPASRTSSFRGGAGATGGGGGGGGGNVVGGGGGGGGGGGKGAKFKSSPLGGGDRTGVVVAERVGAAYSQSSQSQSQSQAVAPKAAPEPE